MGRNKESKIHEGGNLMGSMLTGGEQQTWKKEKKKEGKKRKRKGKKERRKRKKSLLYSTVQYRNTKFVEPYCTLWTALSTEWPWAVSDRMASRKRPLLSNPHPPAVLFQFMIFAVRSFKSWSSRLHDFFGGRTRTKTGREKCILSRELPLPSV